MASGPANATVSWTGAASSKVATPGKDLRSERSAGTDAPAAVPRAAVTWNRTAVWAPAQGPSRAARGAGGVASGSVGPARASLPAQAGGDRGSRADAGTSDE